MIGDAIHSLRRRFRSISGLPDCAFYHDLDCLSGLGDRLVDVWAAMAIADLHEPGALTGVVWEQKGTKSQGFAGIYDTDLFEIENCTFVPYMPRGSFRKNKYQHEFEKNETCMIPLEASGRQIVLREGKNWGANCADKLFRDAQYYGLGEEIGLDRYIASFKKAARGTRPAVRIADLLPEDLGERVGVHVRPADRIAADNNDDDVTRNTWRSVETMGLRYVEQCINAGVGLFVCSHDQQYRAALVDHIRQHGGNVVEIDLTTAPKGMPGYEAVTDFFALTKCKRIVKMSSYSTFPIAAAIAGNKPIVHLGNASQERGQRLDIWRNTLKVLDVNG